MIAAAFLALVACAACFLASGARRASYAALYLGFLPFLTLDPSQGGLVTAAGLAGANVAWKLGMRAVATAIVLTIAWRKRDEVAGALLRPASLPVLFLVGWAVLGLPRALDPWVALLRLGELGAFFLTGVVLWADASRDESPERVARWHALALVPLLVVAAALAVTSPELAFHRSAAGIERMGHQLMNANVLGFAAAAVLLWATHALRRRVVTREGDASRIVDGVVDVIAFALAAWVLFHARSRSATLAFAVGQAILWFPWPDSARDAAILRRERRAFAVLTVACVAVALLALPALQAWFLRGTGAVDVWSGTGRTGLWSELVLRQVPEAPFLGAGYLNLSSDGGFQHAGHHWNNAHSTYLFALVSTGVPGLFAVLAIVLLPLYASFRALLESPAPERDGWRVVFALQSMIAVCGLTGFGVAGFPSALMLVHYGLYAYVTSSRTGLRVLTTFDPRRSIPTSSFAR